MSFVFTYPNAFSPVNADGTPRSPDLGQADVLVKEMITALQMALFDGRIYSTRAALYADLAHAANSWALVIGDPTSGYDGLYQKSGASGSGSWTRVGDVPGSGFIKGTDSGAGNSNAIQVTSPTIPATDGAALIAFNIFEANTGSPVTVSFNGGTALTIKTNSGNDVATGGLTANMMVAGFKSGSTFRLISDQVSAAIVAAAEAAQQAAELARDEAVAAASSVQAIRDSRADAIANYHPISAPNFILTAGYASAGDGGGAQYKKVASEPSHAGKMSIVLDDGVTTVWFELNERVATPEMFGATPFTGDLDDLSTLTTATTALTNWAEYVNETASDGLLTSLYKSASTLSFTREGLNLRGTGSRNSGILFDGCAGIELTLPAGQFTRYSITDFAVLTNADRALGYFGIEVTGSGGAGGADTFRHIERMYLGGQRMFETQNPPNVMSAESGPNRKQAWLRAISLDQSDNTVVRDNRIHGPIWDWNSSYRPPNGGVYISYGIWTDGCTSLEMIENKILFPTYGVRVGGPSEGSLALDNVVGAALGGYLYEDFSGAANWHKIHRNHASCHGFGISYNMDGSAPALAQWPDIQGNLLFMTQGTDFGGFSHIRLKATGGLISGNFLRCAAGTDATVATGLVAQGITVEGNYNIVIGNNFIGLDRMIDIVSGSTGTVFALNVTQASDATSAAPYSDAGTSSIFLANTGDAKSQLWPPARLTVNKSVAQLAALTPHNGATAFCTNETGGAVPVFGDGTNWRRVTDRAIVS